MFNPSESNIEHCIKALNYGGVVMMPTDTVYGLVVRVDDKNAVEKICRLKQRKPIPGTILASNKTQIENLGIDGTLLSVADKYWPGPVSVVFPVEDNNHLHQGLNSIAIRIPDILWLRKLIEETGPLMTSSANLSGSTVLESVEEAKVVFKSNVDHYLDGGSIVGRPSKIIKIDDNGKETILRN